jgi:hypothetical protein
VAAAAAAEQLPLALDLSRSSGGSVGEAGSPEVPLVREGVPHFQFSPRLVQAHLSGSGQQAMVPPPPGVGQFRHVLFRPDHALDLLEGAGEQIRESPELRARAITLLQGLTGSVAGVNAGAAAGPPHPDIPASSVQWLPETVGSIVDRGW